MKVGCHKHDDVEWPTDGRTHNKVVLGDSAGMLVGTCRYRSCSDVVVELDDQGVAPLIYVPWDFHGVGADIRATIEP